MQQCKVLICDPNGFEHGVEWHQGEWRGLDAIPANDRVLVRRALMSGADMPQGYNTVYQVGEKKYNTRTITPQAAPQTGGLPGEQKPR